jgi:hypothetical protein
MADRTRASDAEREETVGLLSRAAAEGRLEVSELDARTAAAYTAATRGDLVRLLDDIPRAQLRLRDDARAQWRVPTRREDAAADLLAFVGPLLSAHGYVLHSRADGSLVFARKRRPAWTRPAQFVLPLGLLARLRKREIVTFELHDHGESTMIVASGQAPDDVWGSLAALES